MSTPGRRAGLVPRHPVAALMLVLVTALVAACSGASGGANASLTPVFVEAVTQPPLGSRETAYDPPRPSTSLRLTDGDGRPFDLASLQGGPVFVYFGYTHCPDVCPTTLADVREGIRRAGVDARVVFVTIDPGRDDAPAMKQYAGFYGPGFIGLTGTAAQIAQAASTWGVSYTQLSSDSAGGYAMAHSTDTYLVDASGELRHHIFFGAGADLIAKLLLEVARP